VLPDGHLVAAANASADDERFMLCMKLGKLTSRRRVIVRDGTDNCTRAQSWANGDPTAHGEMTAIH
jgi:hypothetical protein